MGLGKTLQTIAFLAALLGKDSQRGAGREEADNSSAPPKRARRQALVVVPKTLLGNWTNELGKWACGFRTRVYFQSGKEATLAAARRGEAEIVLTTYDVWKRPEVIEALSAVPWACIVCDEAHLMQSEKTKLHEAAVHPAWGGAFKLLLTGTPGSNNMLETFSLLSIAKPGCLGAKDVFKDYYMRPIELGQQVDATQLQLGKMAKRRGDFLKIVKENMLNRFKRDEAIVAELAAAGLKLTKKTERVLFCELAPLQKEAYRRMTESADFEILRRYHEPCDCGSGEGRGSCCHTECDGPFYHMRDHEECQVKCPTCLIFNFMHLAKMCANHLDLVKAEADPLKDPDAERRARNALVAKAILGPGAKDEDAYRNWRADSPTLTSFDHCGKLRVLHSLLQSWKGGRDKVLLFSNSVVLLHMLERYLEQAGYTYVTLVGDVKSAAERERMVADFNSPRSSTFIFLSSFKVGSTGINLTSANRVVIFDPDWNPATESQAQARSDRIGQLREVTVYRLIAAHTIEEVMYMRQLAKQHLSDGTLKGGDAEMARLFKGLKSDRMKPGDLYGMVNLFAVIPDDVRMAAINQRALKVEDAYTVMNWGDSEDETEDEVEEEEEEEREEGAAKPKRAAKRARAPEPAEEEGDDVADLPGVLYARAHASMVKAAPHERQLAAHAQAALGADEEAPPAGRDRKRKAPAERKTMVGGVVKKVTEAAEAAMAEAAERSRLARARLEPMASFYGSTVEELARELQGMDEAARGRKRDEFLLVMGRAEQTWRRNEGGGAAAGGGGE